MTDMMSIAPESQENDNFDIKLKLDKRFCRKLKQLKRKYGEEFELLNGLHNKNLNFTEFIDNFVDKSKNVADSTIDPNANSSTKDICSLIFEMPKAHRKLLSFNKIYYEICKAFGQKAADEWLEDEWSGAMYMHDAFDSSQKSYCFAYDLDELAAKGLYFIGPQACTGPAKHYTTFLSHVFEFISWNANRTSGAVGLPSLLVYMWYFWDKDVKSGYYVKSPEYYRDQGIQEIIHKINQTCLRVNQSAFTNVTIMDHEYLRELFGGRIFPDGSLAIEHIDEIADFEKRFMEIVSSIRSEKMYTFPVITYALLYKDGKFTDEPFARWCSDHNMKWNDANFFNSADVTSLSSCCRLINNFKTLGFINSIGGTALKIGSVKVNTINLMRIALESKSSEEFMKKLKREAELCMKVLHIVRSIIQRNVEKGLLPNYSYKCIDLSHQFNTIGINGMYEAVSKLFPMREDEFHNKFYTDEGLAFACSILDELNEEKDRYIAENKLGYKINIEAVPAERAAVIFAKKDSLLFPEYPEKFQIYSNQWIPLTQKTTIQHKLMLGAKLDVKCGGGQISHINLDAPFKSSEMAWKMLNQIAASGVIYFAFNTKIKTCKNNHAWSGPESKCPVCGEPVATTWQRIVGYITPETSYSKERKAEFSKRFWFNLNDR